MKVTVFDEEAYKSKHDLVGEVTVDLAKILSGEVQEQTIEIKFKNKKAGEVNLKFDVMNLMAANVGSSLLAGLGLPNALQMQQQQQQQLMQ